MNQKQNSNSYHIGFSSLNTQTEYKIDYTGILPSWLTGSLLFVGPAKFDSGQNKVNHWLDGLSMLHSFSFENNQISYKNNFLNSSSFINYTKKNKLSYDGFAQDPQSSIIKKFIANFIPSKKTNLPQNANFNIANINNNFVTLAPFCNPVSFDPNTLETLDILNYNDNLFNFDSEFGYENPFPAYDNNKKEIISFTVTLGDPNKYIIYKINNNYNQRIVLATYHSDKLYYTQDLAITNKYVIITLCPLIAQSSSLLIKSKPFIQNFKWSAKLGTKFLIIDRISGEIIEKQTSPFFALTQINAFEKNNNIILDLISYPDSTFIDQFYFEQINNSEHISKSGNLSRYIINLDNNKNNNIWSEIISNAKLDYAVINNNYNSQEYNYIYGTEFNPYLNRNYNLLYKINTKTHKYETWQEDYCYPSKPIFIANPNPKSEDDGILASIVLDTQKKISFLLLIEANSFTEIARAYINHHIPFGVTGIYKKTHAT